MSPRMTTFLFSSDNLLKMEESDEQNSLASSHRRIQTNLNGKPWINQNLQGTRRTTSLFGIGNPFLVKKLKQQFTFEKRSPKRQLADRTLFSSPTSSREIATLMDMMITHVAPFINASTGTFRDGSKIVQCTNRMEMRPVFSKVRLPEEKNPQSKHAWFPFTQQQIQQVEKKSDKAYFEQR